MKKITNIILLSILISVFTSCKKAEYHKIMYEVTFLGKPGVGSSSMIDIYALPNYTDKKPTIDNAKIPQVWRYEYLNLQKGQKIYFAVRGQLSYHFEMRVYIDGVQKSYRRVIVSPYNYYDDHVEESYGLNDSSDEDMGLIEFTY
jgi:hypothetical protein